MPWPKIFEIVDSVKQLEEGHLTKHTHLTRDIKRRKNGLLYYGYNYIHWKFASEISHISDRKRSFPHSRGLLTLVPFYVGESASPTKYDYFRRSSEKHYQSKQEGMLQWQKEAKEGYVTWIINRVPFQQNLQLEKFLIAFYGRYDLGKGPLVNRNDGGRSSSGRLHTDESKEKISLYATEQRIIDWGPTISQSITGVPKKTSTCIYCGVEQAIESFASESTL